MTISREEFDDLRAQVMAQKLLINAILIALVDKKTLTNADIDILIEATLASLSQSQDSIIEATASHLEDFRDASQQPG